MSEENYEVFWAFDAQAVDPYEAAQKALEVMKHPEQPALHFKVRCKKTGKVTEVDLNDPF